MQAHFTAEPDPTSGVRSQAEPPQAPGPGRGLVDARYAIERLVAAGGAAEVYAARHRFTRRLVALKLPLPGAPPEVHVRLRREIELLSRLDHPGVVQLLDAGETPEGPYAVLELLEGRTLEAIIGSRGTMAEAEVLRVGIALAEALAACHERGILHRDVKPANVVVGQALGLKLIDFNIARDADEPRRLTQVGQVLGTIDYMPIEAMLGLATADHRVDVFGLGMTLYECLLGAVPAFSARSVTAADVFARRPDVSPGLATAIQHALARDPAERTQTMAELLGGLRACVQAPPAERTGSELRRHPRAPYLTPVRVLDAQGVRWDGRMEEISSSGAQLVTPQLLEQGSALRLRFALPSGQIAQVDAVVRWARQGARAAVVGVEFAGLSREAQAVIGLYVQGTVDRK